MATDRETLKKSLSGVDFPVSKENLVSYAEDYGFDEETLRALRALPVADYSNLTEVMRSARLDKGTEEQQSDSDQAHQAGQHKQGLAEHERATPTNPIAEELGENRKR